MHMKFYRYCGMTRLQPETATMKTDKIPVPNPIITVTEHTPAPTPSPDRMYRYDHVTFN